MSSIKLRASAKDGVTTVKALISHPMETGSRKDSKTGEKIPAHFIEEVVATHNGNTVMTASWGAAISKNPYLSFSFKGGAPGDKVGISWVDNKGEKDADETAIK
jgi:sulfur-oxidizing protein SoxZ